MDPSTALGLAPNIGAVGVLLAVIAYLLKQNHADRGQYRADVARIEKRAAQDLKALAAAHTEQMDKVDKKLADLNDAVTTALDETDRERHLRWIAQEETAGLRLKLASIPQETRP